MLFVLLQTVNIVDVSESFKKIGQELQIPLSTARHWKTEKDLSDCEWTPGFQIRRPLF